MIVYGDQSWRASVRDLATSIDRRLASGSARVLLDETRLRLVLAGQLEQALADAAERTRDACLQQAAGTAAALTRRIACAFVAQSVDPALEDACDWTAVSAMLAGIADACERADVEVRTPEGFAWYALYPDGYAGIASDWLVRHRCRRVLIIGLRSIGTTLAAVVAAVLERAGVTVHVACVRPRGHPFARRCALPPTALLALPVDRCLVVDEGPGLSGSSMAAVAEALSGAGVERSTIDFLAGHGNGPGQKGDAAVHDWWTPQRVLHRGFAQVEIAGRTLPHRLYDMAGDMLGEAPRTVEDLGGGAWRGVAAAGERSRRPLAMARLERPKLLARTPSGSGVLLRFAGIAWRRPTASSAGAARCLAEHEQDATRHMAERGLTVPAAEARHGWLAVPWIEGRRLGSRDLDAAMLDRLAEVVACAAGPPLDTATAAASIDRIGHMLATNAHLMLGRNSADIVSAGTERLAVHLAAVSAGWPRHGDGRCAPWEWIRRSDGVVLKTDCGGHDQDHTVVGAQPVAWDLAGAAVEWRLDDVGRAALAARVAERLPLDPAPERGCLAWWCAAYAALRAAMTDLARAEAVEPCERALLARAGLAYRARLARAVAELAGA